MATANVKAVITAEDRASAVLGKFGTKSAAIMGAVAGVVNSVTTKAIDVLSDSIGTAIKRVDTLNNSNRVFENMGFKTNDVSKAMNSLKDSILGLPTPLDQAVSGMQMIASTVPDINKAQAIFSAMNDAIIGFGGSADMVQNAVLQLSQAFSNGRIDAQTWNSMMNSGLGPTLNAIAKQMGITTGALKDGLSDGTYSVTQFQDALVKLDKEGGGGLKSLQTIAHDATAGINTGMENAKTAIARGMGNIIQAIGPEKISGAISKVGSLMEQGFNNIAKALPIAIAGIKTVISGNFDPNDWPKQMGIAEDSPIIDGLLTVRETFLTVFNFVKGIVVASSTAIGAAIGFLAPSFEALWNTIQNQLWPSIQNLYTSIEPLIPVIGTILVAAIWVLINGFNLVIKAITFVNNVAAGLYNFFFKTIPEAFRIGVAFIVEKINYLKNNFWETIGFIIGFFATLPIKIPFFIMGAIAKVISFLASINWGGVLSSIGRAFQNVWNSVWESAKNIFNSLKNMKWGEILAGIGKGIGNGVIGLVEGAINGAISGIPGMGKIKLPRFAEGVQNFGGGAAIVGERGPEVVQLPRGSNVIPNHELGGKTEVNITIQAGAFMGSQSDARKLAMMVIEAAKDVAGSKNMSITEMLGA